MNKTLMIPMAAILPVLASCAKLTNPAPVGSSASTEKTALSASAEKKDAADQKSSVLRTSSVSASNLPSRPFSGTIPAGVTLPPMPDMGEDVEGSPMPMIPLPGDLRGKLRSPDMPSTLPMSVDGKINPSAF